MLTNIVCSVVVALVTNVVETDNTEGCATMDGIRRNNWALYHRCDKDLIPYVAATERYFTTNVNEVTTWTFIGPDKQHQVQEFKLLSSVKATFTKSPEWVFKSATLVPAPVEVHWTNWLTITNGR